jgi:putative transcriptional regulator
MNFNKQMLVSLPPLMDNNFQKSVVYLDSHDGDGAKGWIINKELENRVSVRLRKSIQLAINAPIFYGGPVDINSAFVLHSPDIRVPSTVLLNEELCVTRDKEMVAQLNQNHCPRYFRIVIGRCSWGAGQLESEMLGSRTNGKTLWTSCPYDPKYFWMVPNEQWEKGIERSANSKVTNYLNF